MEVAIFSLIGAVVLNALWAYVTMQVRRYRNLKAVQIEVDEAIRIASVYLGDGIRCPLYRIPTVAFDNSGVELLKDGVFNEKQLAAFLQYGNQVSQVNRGLDYMNEHRVRIYSNKDRESDSDELWDTEYSRLIAKCKELRDGYGLSMKTAVGDRLGSFAWVGHLRAAVR